MSFWTTSLEEMALQLAESGPFTNEALIEYGYFVSDSFGRNPSQSSARAKIQFYDSNSVPAQIDHFDNDDSYRQSRHFVNQNKLKNLSLEETALGLRSHLRENSLARQLQSKRDQPAIIRLIQRVKPGTINKATNQRFDSPWANVIPPNTKFFLEQVTENREEKVQVLDTFGEFVAFFFGARPEVYTYSGTLLNTLNHDWKNEFQLNYEYFLRGTQAVKNRATMFMQYDDVFVEGYMLNSQIRQTGVDDKSIPFTFSLLVLNRSAMNPRNLLVARNARQQLTAFEEALLTNLKDALLLASTSKTEDVDTYLLMREWLNGQAFPSAGMATRRTNTNNVEPDRTKSAPTGKTETPPNAGFEAKNTVDLGDSA